jgi:predicted nucleic acid-binding protein
LASTGCSGICKSNARGQAVSLTSLISQSKFFFIDTAPLIYFIEAHPIYGEMVKQVIMSCTKKKILIASSVITLHEVLVRPYRDANTLLAEKFSTFLKNNRSLRMLIISEDVSELAAKLRGDYAWLKLADAFQIAAALDAGADLFLTNDKQLKQIREIQVVVLDDWRELV